MTKGIPRYVELYVAPVRFRIPAAVRPDSVTDSRANSPNQGLDLTQSLIEQQRIARTPHIPRLAKRGRCASTEENWKSVLREDDVDE